MIAVPPFSLSQGGRLHSALIRSGLAGSDGGRRRLLGVLLVVGWLPLILISAATGTALGGFDRHWMAPAAPSGAELLDSPQSSTLIDFASTYGTVRAMRPVAITVREVAAILLPGAAPFAPLLLYQYSITDILEQVVRLVR